jgi:hypothetical protein
MMERINFLIMRNFHVFPVGKEWRVQIYQFDKTIPIEVGWYEAAAGTRTKAATTRIRRDRRRKGIP